MAHGTVIVMATSKQRTLRDMAQLLENFVFLQFQIMPQAHVDRSTTAISIRCAAIELDVRLHAVGWPLGTLVISRLNSVQPRDFHAQTLIQFLARYAPEFGLQALGIENPLPAVRAVVDEFDAVPLREQAQEAWMLPLSVLELVQ
jgi:hypothetical protein